MNNYEKKIQWLKIAIGLAGIWTAVCYLNRIIELLTAIANKS